MTNPILTAIRFRDQHRGVVVLQQELNRRLGGITVDGDYGPRTQEAVRQIQRAQGSALTGDCEQSLIQYLNLDLTPTRITEADVRQTARNLGVHPAVCMSVLKTECNWPNKPGYFRSNRPAILFERHYFYRYLSKVDPALANRLAQTHPHICNRSYGGYKGGEREWDRLNEAASYHSSSALMSASYGLAQVMGAHYALLGYPSVQHMVRAAAASEQDQLRFFERFVKAHPAIHQGMRTLNWNAVARGYNGPARVSEYGPKLAQNYQHFVRQGVA